MKKEFATLLSSITIIENMMGKQKKTISNIKNRPEMVLVYYKVKTVTTSEI